MAKRKRQAGGDSGDAGAETLPGKKAKATDDASPQETTAAGPETIQIVAGSYDQVLHGLTATIGPERDAADFANTFLFNAHASAIRCVAVSPPSAPVAGQTQKVLLASGSTDERINVYNLSAHPPSRRHQELLAKVASRPILENPKNRELGTLLHHASTVTALRFPTRSKLLSASEDSTVAVTRTRDWSVLSTIKAPVAKPQGRPSGDTAPAGTTPSGVNDLAIHPSMKLMISVSKGERCMRLWNLVTGKKAGVLNFDKAMLHEIGEGRHSTGEGRRVVWGSVDGADEFAVGFDRDIVVFGMDSVPKCRVMGATARTKIHQFTYVAVDEAAELSLLAVSTEDGRIAFFSTRADDLSSPDEAQGKPPTLRTARLVGHVGGGEAGVTGRIKDFAAVRGEARTWYLVGGGSDGKIRLWNVEARELAERAAAEEEAQGETKEGAKKETTKAKKAKKAKKEAKEAKETKTSTQQQQEQQQPAGQLGRLLGTYETQNRITCLTAFLMIARPEGAEDSEDDVDGDEDADRDGSADEDEEEA